MRDRYYRKPADALGQHLGRLPVGQDCSAVCRAYYQCVLASHALTALDHFPLQSIAPIHGAHQWDMHRAVFARALVAGLGAFGTTHRFSERSGRPHTLLDSAISKCSQVTVSRGLAIAPSMTEILLAQHLGLLTLADAFDETVRYLFMDSFGLDHHHRNPLVFAIDFAFERTRRGFHQRGVILPTEVAPTWGNRNAKAEMDSKFELPEAAKPVAETEAPVAPPVAVEESKPDPSPAEDLQSLPIAIRRIVSAVAEDKLPINRKFGTLHMTEEGLALNVPKAYHELGEAFSLSPSDMQLALESDTFVPKNFRYKVRRKGQGKKHIRLRLIAPAYQEPIGRLLSVPADGALERQELDEEPAPAAKSAASND